MTKRNLEYRVGDGQYRGIAVGDTVRVGEVIDPTSDEGQRLFSGIEDRFIQSRKTGLTGKVFDIMPDQIHGRPEALFLVSYDEAQEAESEAAKAEAGRFGAYYAVKELVKYKPEA